MERVTNQKSTKLNQISNTNYYLPCLGIGCAYLGEVFDKVPITDAIKVFDTAVDHHGVTYFDTAPYYGNGCSEARLGIAINKKRSENPNVVIKVSTKVGKTLDPAPKEADALTWTGGYNLKIRRDYTYTGIMQQHRESCLRLGIPSVDALVIHDIDDWHCGDEKEYHLKQFLDPLDGGLKALLELKLSGSIKAIGIGCNGFQHGTLDICRTVGDSAEQLAKEGSNLKDCKALDFILCAGPYNLLNQEALDDMIPYCQKQNLSLIVGCPYGGVGAILATGVKHLSSKEEATKNLQFVYSPATQAIIQKVESIENICEDFGVSLGAAALQFPLRHPVVKCVLAGVKSQKEMNAAVEYMNETIPEAFWKELEEKKLIKCPLE